MRNYDILFSVYSSDKSRPLTPGHPSSSSSTKPGTQQLSQNYPLLSLKEPVRQQALLWKAQAIFRHSPLQSPERLLQEANPLHWAAEAPGRQRQEDFSVFKASHGYRVRLLDNNHQGYLKEEQGGSLLLDQLTLYQGARLRTHMFSSSPVLWPLQSPAPSSRMPSRS